MKHSVLKQSLTHSPLASTSVLAKKPGMAKKVIESSLLLTSLVDAFSILVIYLLVNTSAGVEELKLSQDIRLPVASTSGNIKNGIVVKIDKGKYHIADKEVSLSELEQVLSLYKNDGSEKSDQLIVQADQSMTYAQLNPVILAGSASGFSDIKFAVVKQVRR